MKIGEKILPIILLSLFIFTGCKKDKDGDSPNNYIKYDGEMYHIDKGILENYGQWDAGAYNLDLTLFSNEIKLIESQGEITGVTGTGNYIYFEMFTSSTTHLDNGTYQYNYTSEEAGTFDQGAIAINYNIEYETGEIMQEITDGTVKVSKNSDTYEITIDCTDEDGKSVTGYFKGTLTWYDASWKKSTKSHKRRF